MEKHFGIALEGTGWYVHHFLGRIQALNDHGIYPEQAVATSGGIVVACAALLQMDMYEVKERYDYSMAKHGFGFKCLTF